MKPSLSLGPWDSPEIEFEVAAFNAIIATLVEQFPTLEGKDKDSLWSLILLDGAHLYSNSASLFKKIALVCQQIISRESSNYNPSCFEKSEYVGYLKGGPGSGNFGYVVLNAAEEFLRFLSLPPSHWPP